MRTRSTGQGLWSGSLACATERYRSALAIARSLSSLGGCCDRGDPVGMRVAAWPDSHAAHPRADDLWTDNGAWLQRRTLDAALPLPARFYPMMSAAALVERGADAAVDSELAALRRSTQFSQGVPAEQAAADVLMAGGGARAAAAGATARARSVVMLNAHSHAVGLTHSPVDGASGAVVEVVVHRNPTQARAGPRARAWVAGPVRRRSPPWGHTRPHPPGSRRTTGAGWRRA